MRGYTPGKNRKVHRVTVTKNPQKYCLDNGVLYSLDGDWFLMFTANFFIHRLSFYSLYCKVPVS